MTVESGHEVARGPHLIDLPSGAGLPDLDSYISLDDRIQRLATSIVLRLPADLLERLKSPDAADIRSDLLGRVTGLPLQALSFVDGQTRLFSVEMSTLIEQPTQSAEEVRQIDLFRLVSKHEDVCFYRNNPHHHYVAPSLNHCSAFFRLGDAIRSREALECLAFLVAPARRRRRRAPRGHMEYFVGRIACASTPAEGCPSRLLGKSSATRPTGRQRTDQSAHFSDAVRGKAQVHRQRNQQRPICTNRARDR